MQPASRLHPLERPARRRRWIGLVAAVVLCPVQAFAQSVAFDSDLDRHPLIGQSHSVAMVFSHDGSSGVPVGYSPFVDIFVQRPGADFRADDEPCDGARFVSASAVFTSPGAIPLSEAARGIIQAGSGDRCAGNRLSSHPFGVPFPAGMNQWHTAVVELPFASFVPGQPAVPLDIRVEVPSFADLHHPLTLCARAGFRYGGDPTGGSPATLGQVDPVCVDLVPHVYQLSRAYLGPESGCPETATGPNYPRRNRIVVDIADGQLLTGSLRECLGDQLVFQPGSLTIGGAAVTTPPLTSEPGPGPGGCIALGFVGDLTGTTSGNDIVVTYAFHVPEVDRIGTPILGPGSSCEGGHPEPDVEANFTWRTPDPRDPDADDRKSARGGFAARCLAVQKTAPDLIEDPDLDDPPGPSPGDLIEYVISAEVSDYRTIGFIVVTDHLTDGQSFSPSPAPTLELSDKFGSLTVPFELDESMFATEIPSATCKGGLVLEQPTELLFLPDVAIAIAAPPVHPRLLAGFLTGGRAGLPSGGPATMRIRFHARIDDEYQRLPLVLPDLDPSVDKHDVLINCVVVDAVVMRNQDDSPGLPGSTSFTASDDSLAGVELPGLSLGKSIYQVHRDGNLVSPDLIAPDDIVTFRLTYPVRGSDAENVRLRDYLPSPLFRVDDADARVATPPSWSPSLGFPLCLSVAPIPLPPGHANIGPDDDLCLFLTSLGKPDPTLTPVHEANALGFDYGPEMDDPADRTRTADLLFSLRMTAEPYPDCAVVMNHAEECETSSFGEQRCQTAVEPVTVGQPLLRVRKGVIAVDHGVYPYAAAPFLFHRTPDATCPSAHPIRDQPHLPNLPAPRVTTPGTAGFRLTDAITSADLDDCLAFNSDVDGVDAGDVVTYAVIIENTGKSPRGAWDVILRDSAPANWGVLLLSQPGNFEVTYGDGSPAICDPGTPCRNRAADFFLPGLGMRLRDGLTEGSLAAKDDPDGHNILVITYDRVVSGFTNPGLCEDNTATIATYAGIEGGPNHTETPFATGPLTDTATVCSRTPRPSKTILATSELRTSAQPFDCRDDPCTDLRLPICCTTPSAPECSCTREDLAIGEQVRYEASVSLPEGVWRDDVILIERLPPGVIPFPKTLEIEFVDTSVLSLVEPWKSLCPTGCSPVPPALFDILGDPATGIDLRFPISRIHNGDDDAEEERIVIRFTAQVLNHLQDGDLNDRCNGRNNRFVVQHRDPRSGARVRTRSSVNDARGRVVEPTLRCTKTGRVDDPSPGIQSWTLTCRNVGEPCRASAFDVVIEDQLLAGSLHDHPATVPVVTQGDCTVTVLPTADGFRVECDEIPRNDNVVVEFTTENVVCDDLNSLEWTWSSLRGDIGDRALTTVPPPPLQGPPGELHGERTGSDSPAPNDYHRRATFPLVCDPPTCMPFGCRDDFHFACPGLPVEDFETGQVGNRGLNLCNSKVDASGSTTCDTCASVPPDCFGAGDIEGGIAFTNELDVADDPDCGLLLTRRDACQGWTDSMGSSPDLSLLTRYTTESFDIELQPPVFAVGFDIVTCDLERGPDHPVTATIHTTQGIVSLPASGAPQGRFFGILCDAPITRVNLLAADDVSEGVDDVEFGSCP